MNTRYYLEELRKHVQKKAGVEHVDAGDCRRISDVIYSETRKYVSETTIKRFFGYASTQFNFSGFTLNSLSQFIGFESWRNFCENSALPPQAEMGDLWNDLKQKASTITEYSLRAAHNHSGIPFDHTAKRKFAYVNCQYFLKSDARLSCIVAPAGYGKSVAVAQMVESLLGDKDRNKEDIVLYINMSIIPGISLLGFDFSEWIREEVGLGEKEGYRSYFEQHPDIVRGKVIVVIDGFDSGESESRYTKLLLNFLYSIEKAPWTKVVLSMRTNTWLAQRQHIYNSAFLLNALYKDNFFDTEYNSNLPLLSKIEALYSLNLIDKTNYKIDEVNTDLLRQLKTPLWLQYYYHFKFTNNIIPPDSPLLGYELIIDFVKSKIHEDNHSTESMLLLQHIATQMRAMGDVYGVRKQKLLGLISAYPAIYTALVQKGILLEQKKVINNMPEEMISMLHDFYPYFLYKHLLENNNGRINEAFFGHLADSYSDNIPLRLKLIKWAVRDAILNNEATHLISIITLPFTAEEKNTAFSFVCVVTNYELEKPGISPLATHIDPGFMNLMIKGAISTKQYRKTITLLTEAVDDIDQQITLLAAQGGFYILELNKGGLKRTIYELGKHKNRLKELFPFSPFELLRYHYEKLCNEKPSIDLNAYIAACLTAMPTKPRKITSFKNDELISFRLAIHVLYLHKDSKNATLIMDRIHRLFPKLWCRRTSLFAGLSKLFAGYNAVSNRNLKTAKRIYDHMEKLITNSKQVYYSNYLLIRYHVFRSNYKLALADQDAALKEIDIALNIAHSDELDLFVLLINMKKIDLLRHMGSQEKLSKAFNEQTKLLKHHHLTAEDVSRMTIG